MKKPIYERQSGESTKAFEAFVIYRNMGADRSLEKVGKELGKSLTLMERWSSKHNWVERVKEYDAYMDRKTLMEEEKKRKEMAKRHAQQAMMFQQKVLERMNTLRADELSPNDLIRWFSEAVKIERLSRGVSTEVSEVKHTDEVTEHEQSIFERVNKYAEIYKKLADSNGFSGTYESDDNRE